MEAQRSRTSFIGGAIISSVVAIVSSALILGTLAILGIRGDDYAELLPAGAIFLWGTFVSFLVVGPPALVTGAIVSLKCHQWLQSGLEERGVLLRTIILSAIIGCVSAAIVGMLAPAGMTPQFLAPIGLVIGAVSGLAAAKATISDYQHDTARAAG